MSRIRVVLVHIGVSTVVWLALTIGFGVWVWHVVDEEYRLGYRTATDGDAIMIPIAGFAMLLAVAIAVGNLLRGARTLGAPAAGATCGLTRRSSRRGGMHKVDPHSAVSHIRPRTPGRRAPRG